MTIWSIPRLHHGPITRTVGPATLNEQGSHRRRAYFNKGLLGKVMDLWVYGSVAKTAFQVKSTLRTHTPMRAAAGVSL